MSLKWLVLLIVSLSLSCVAQPLRVSLLLTPKQRDSFHFVFEAFTQETGIHIQTIIRSDEDYKSEIDKWLKGGENSPDVLHWQASERLFQFSRKGLIRPINHLWQELKLADSFAHLQSGVSEEGQVYALPFAYYHWGIFYRKSLIDKHGGPQRFWEDFVRQCEQLKQAGITPIGIGTKNYWPAAAWFDHLNLRINDLSFHQQLLRGEVSFYDPRLTPVYEQWASLIKLGFFNADHHDYAWDEVLPIFYRERIAFLLLGNFVATKWPAKLEDDIGFMPFPVLYDLPTYEVAPTDVFMIAQHTKKVYQAEEFIKYMARAEVQAQIAEGLGYIPASTASEVSSDSLVSEGASMLKESIGVSQYFDRDTIPAFEQIAVKAFTRFLDDADIPRLKRDLEQARQFAFKLSASLPKAKL
ncbi:ABC transporter substrate-binding protein [Agarivorans albus]|uniref:Carbohydrate uptake transporter-1 (CUT1) family n=1 Tax=Agarivorans albus MKT 106 TaxID=1331007 RepID=R9PHD1_AGAAL|nr:ABC transporter substrate-binding protein [Agarivorans albus]GAD00668.1 carbohydrate uptake transporter-1 (CUT1) family [Agarivorans albus MKT 106]